MRWFLLSAVIMLAAEPTAQDGPRVLVVYETAGFRHDSIPDALRAISDASANKGFVLEASATSDLLKEGNLARYRAIVFLLTSGDMLDDEESTALTQYVQQGGGFVGIHSAADTEHDNDAFRQLLGAEFRSHPPIQPGAVLIEDATHPSTAHLPASWLRVDEWYDFTLNPRGGVHVLATVDESSYQGGQADGDHPIAWCTGYGKGRSWYTALGHTSESYKDPLFVDHLLGGLGWAAGLLAGECDARRGKGDGVLLERGTTARSTLPSLALMARAGEVITLSGSIMARYSGATDIRIDGQGDGRLRLTGVGEVQLTGPTTAATFHLEAGRRYPMALTYRASDTANLEVWWKPPGQEWEVISRPQLYLPRQRPLRAP